MSERILHKHKLVINSFNETYTDLEAIIRHSHEIHEKGHTHSIEAKTLPGYIELKEVPI